MEILLGLTSREIIAIRKMRIIAEIRYRELVVKEDAEGLNAEEENELDELSCIYELIEKMEALVDHHLVSVGGAVEHCLSRYGQTKYDKIASKTIMVVPVDELSQINTPKMSLDDTKVLEEHFAMMNRRREHEKNMTAIRKVIYQSKKI